LATSINLPQNVQTLLTIKADVSGIGPGSAGMDGHVVKVDLADANGSGVSSGAAVDSGPVSSGSVNGVGIFRSYPTLASVTIPTTLVAGTETLDEFSVTANANNSISLDKFNVNIATSSYTSANGSTNVNGLIVYAYTDSGFSQPVSGFSNGQLNTSITNLISSGATTVTVNNGSGPLVISQGTTYYFKVVGTIAQVGGSNGDHGSVQTYIAGDGTAPVYPFMFPVGTVNGTFIWSPNATTTPSSVNTNDWTSGYGVVGLPSTGMQATTLSN
jgi:hypothetical protein